MRLRRSNLAWVVVLDSVEFVTEQYTEWQRTIEIVCKNAIYCSVGSFIKSYTVAFELFVLIVTYQQEKRALLHLAEKQIAADNF